jgi:DNA-binding SARP family transcriptional activator
VGRAPVVAAASTPSTTDGVNATPVTSCDGGRVRLSLLRGFELRDCDRLVRVPLSAQRLIAFLALHGRPLQRLYVAGSLWLDCTQEHANANLRTALWRLRRPGCAVVSATAMELSLAPNVAVDVHETEGAARRVLAHTGAQSDLERLCVAGDLLPGWYDDWLLIERERLRQLRVHALECLCDDLASRGEFAAATAAGVSAVAAEPLRESAHRVLIRAHLAEGNAAEAIRQYRLYRTLVRSQLGIEPSRQLRDLMRGLRLSARQAMQLGLEPG